MTKKWKTWFDFTLALTSRELKGRYKHVALGFLWIVINPLMQMLVIGLVFQFFPIFKTENYFLFLFLGLLPWNFFTSSFSTGVPLFVNERHLIKKAVFPRESLIISLILSNLFHFLIGLLLVLPFAKAMISFGLLIGAILWLFSFVIGITLLFASLDVRFRDVDFFAKAILPLWFYATPIIYTLSILPQWLQRLLALNPLTPIIQMFRTAFGIQAEPILPQLFFWPLFLTVLVIILSIFVFKKEEKYFDDWM